MNARALHLQSLPMLLVFIGGALGTTCRYLLSLVVPTPWQLPLPTLLVNLVGAFVLGLLLEGLLRRGPDEGARQRLRLLAGPGFCGGFTTYSSLCVDAEQLFAHARYVEGALYAIGSLVLGIAAAAAGVWAAQQYASTPHEERS